MEHAGGLATLAADAIDFGLGHLLGVEVLLDAALILVPKLEVPLIVNQPPLLLGVLQSIQNRLHLTIGLFQILDYLNVSVNCVSP